MPVTSGDRVLIHLFTRGEPDGWFGGVSDQDLIASSCGIGRTHIPRTLKPLINVGLIKEDLGRAPGKPRRVKVYSLTEKGTIGARESILRCEKDEIDWIDDEGISHHGTVRRSLDMINQRLASLSMGSIPLPLFLSAIKDTIPWNDIIWTSASTGHDNSGMKIPEGWKPSARIDRIDGNIFGKDELESIDKKMEENGMVLLKGPVGSGKRELTDLWAQSRNRKVLVLEKGNFSGNLRDEKQWDLLVLLDGGDPDVDRLLQNDIKISDIRDGSWPPNIREIDMIMTTSVDMELSGPVIEVKGISKDRFLGISNELGIGSEISDEIYLSSKGSIDAVRYIKSLTEDDILHLNELELDEAVLKVLLGIKNR